MLFDVLERIKDRPDDAFVERIFTEEQAKSIFDWKDISNLVRTNTKYFEIIDKEHKKMNIPWFEHDWEGIYGVVQNKQWILNKIRSGYGFTILGQAFYNEKIYDLSKTLEEELNQVLDVHVYAAYSKTGKSFEAHSDASCNVILQLDGTSLWRIYAEKRHDIESGATKKLTEVFSVDLHPGMILYIPRWLYHKCEPREKRISLSFAMMDVVKAREPRINFDL